ncbi:MAG: hypothetical protein UFP03_04840, partial [Paludibacteraceae bacterium]|nr:hypothetical protein [Paludibacteraceae bacterium]
ETAIGTATYSVENANNVAVELTGDAAFSIASTSNGVIDITFTPEAAGTFNGTITITADDVVTESIDFSASAVLKPVITNITAPVFEEIKVGGFTTAIATYTLENATSAKVELTGDNAFFIKKHTSSEVEIVFMPEIAGSHTATLTISVGNIAESIEFSAIAIEDIATSIEETETLCIYANNGTIYCDEEFAIYNLAGVNVTHLNGSLQGVYVVITNKGNQQISAW